MRKSLWIMLAVMVVAIGAPNAHADTIIDGTLNFTVTPNHGSPTPTGSFVWDSTTSTWSSFTVDWDGAVYNFASLFPDLAALATSGSWCAAAPLPSFSTTCPFSNFLLDGMAQLPNAPTFSDINAEADGTYTVTETVVGTPEPSSAALMLLGVGLAFAMRKRVGQRLPQAS